MSEKIEVVVVVDVIKQASKADVKSYEEYLKKEGFLKIEDNAYQGFGTTAVMNIRAFIFNVFDKAFDIGGYQVCKIICQIGKNNFEAYMYENNSFKEISLS